MINMTAPRGGRARYRSGAVVGVLVAVVGLAVGVGGKMLFVAFAVVLLPFTSLLIDNAVRGVRGRAGILTIEVPLVLLLFSDTTFRVRTTEQLSNNPFDTAGIIRAVTQAVAMFLALVALISPGERERGGRLTTRPFRIYCAYCLVASAGIAMSGFPILTAYRVF